MITQDAFLSLPLTVSLKEFCAWTGLTPAETRALAVTGGIGRMRVGTGPKMAKHRYFKVDIARIGNFKF